MIADSIDREVLQRYLVARKAITKHADRIVAVSHLMGLWKQCSDDAVTVSPASLAIVADMIDQDICSIQEQLDEFIYVLDAEEVAAR